MVGQTSPNLTANAADPISQSRPLSDFLRQRAPGFEPGRIALEGVEPL